jgi:hypothetical protein
MKKQIAAAATVALALGLSASASAATPNDNASCSGLRAVLAGQPGLAAASAHFIIEVGNSVGLPPGKLWSDTAHGHIGNCPD